MALRITGIRLTNIRAFEGEHFIPLAPGLTVLMGRNNAGKSTVLRAPFLFLPRSRDKAPQSAYCRSGAEIGEVALRVEVSASDFESALGFGLQRARDVRVRTDAGMMELASLEGFADWQNAPVVEVGFRYIASTNNVLRSLRIVPTDAKSDSFLYVSTLNGEPAKVYYQRTERENTAQAQWFGGAFLTLENEGQVLRPSLLAHWEHHRVDAVSGWIQQSERRLVDTDETRLQEVLTFLRMKHPSEFERLSRALGRALPEFEQLDFIDVEQRGFQYRPAFVAKGRRDSYLARENIGSGAWTFLCVLTAARAAKATGARLLMLDEPHLYLHPGLERLLIDELLDPTEWDGAPLQVVAATHSPTFVDAAVERGRLNILDWKDGGRRAVTLCAVPDTATDVFAGLTSRPSDLLYSDRVVFVEGPSDTAAVQILARKRCGLKVPLRFVPLRESDAVASEVARYFSIVVQSHGAGFRARGLLVLDGDKQATLEAQWSKLPASLDPSRAAALKVVWSDGANGNDIESVFCSEDFLVAYFESHGVAASTGRPRIQQELANVHYPATTRKAKGCTAIRELHEALLTSSGRKIDELEALMEFYVAHADQPYAAWPRGRLHGLEASLATLADA